MNKISILLAFIAGAVNCYAQSAVDTTFENSHYKQRMVFFNEISTRKKAIVFLGNSITEAGDWADIVPEKYILNRGISGDVSFGVIARLNELLAKKPSKIFLVIGVNDLKRGIPKDVIVQNYRKIVNHIKQRSPKTELLLQSVLPINESLLIDHFKAVKNEDIQDLNSALQEIARENSLHYVDLWNVLADEQGQLKAHFTPDGVHLKPIAYVTWVKYLKDLNHL